jgi:hypothetical protein
VTRKKLPRRNSQPHGHSDGWEGLCRGARNNYGNKFVVNTLMYERKEYWRLRLAGVHTSGEGESSFGDWGRGDACIGVHHECRPSEAVAASLCRDLHTEKKM